MKMIFKLLTLTLVCTVATQSFGMLSRVSRMAVKRVPAQRAFIRAALKPARAAKVSNARTVAATSTINKVQATQSKPQALARFSTSAPARAQNFKQQEKESHNKQQSFKSAHARMALGGLAALTGLGTSLVMTDKEFEELEKKRGWGQMFCKNAEIQDGIIKGSTHYRLSSAGKTMVHDYTLASEPIEVQHSPSASFWGYDPVRKVTVFLGKVRISNFDKETLEKMDTLIDPQAKLPTIKKAKIAYCVKRGRHVCFFDENGNEIATTNYRGTIDLKSEKNNINLRPHALLQDLEEVEESKPPFWLFALLGASNTIERMKYNNEQKP